MRGREWIPAHTSQIEKGDWFKIMDDDDVHEALLDAYYVTNDVTGEGEWKVEAKWFKTD
jgi:hypothetical protein